MIIWLIISSLFYFQVIPLEDPIAAKDVLVRRTDSITSTKFAYATKIDQVLRREERGKNQDMWDQFEFSMKNSESLYKKTQRQIRKKKRVEKKMKKEILKNPELSRSESVHSARAEGQGQLEVKQGQRHNSAINLLKLQTRYA